MRLVKDCVSIGEFEIIDDWNHQYVETLPRNEAIKKYGSCPVCSSYTEGSSQIPDGNGHVPSWKTSVWIDIPGFKIGVWNGTNIHLRFCENIFGDKNEAHFHGKKTNRTVTIKRSNPDNPYYYDIDWDFAGFITDSVRSVSARIAVEIVKEELQWRV